MRNLGSMVLVWLALIGVGSATERTGSRLSGPVGLSDFVIEQTTETNEASGTALSDPGRVLLLGNSLTYFNDLPAMLVAIAAQAGKTLRADSFTLPNASLQDHFRSSEVREALFGNNYQWVILQQGPSSLPESQVHLRRWTLRMDGLIRDAGARPALYMVWPAANFGGSFDSVRRSYSNAALKVDGMFIPAGEAWRAGWRLNPDLPLYGGDRFHPSALGTYAAALSMFAALYRQSPVGLPASLTLANGQVHRFDGEHVRDVQTAVWEAHQEYWRAGD
ncbi:MAG: hypothetical protein ACT4NL_14575 [Pseudomarimonas sp.]